MSELFNNDYNLSKIDIIIYIIIINSIIGFIYLIYKGIKKDLKIGVITWLFVSLCPIVGPIYLFFSWIIYALYFKRKDYYISKEELSLKKENIKVLLKPDMEDELNKVPLEEALIISDKKNARKLLLNVLKDDRNSSVKSILKAVEHNDTEVSHYAASAISDIINEFKTYEKTLRTQYYEDKHNNLLGNRYADYLYNFLSQNILSITEQKRYASLLEELILLMEEYLPLEVSGSLYYKIICILLDLGENQRAKFWIEKAISNNVDELDTYRARLRYHYMNQDNKEFIMLLEKLKKSDIIIDNELLEIVRFYGS